MLLGGLKSLLVGGHRKEQDISKMDSSTLEFDLAHPCAIVDMGSNGIRFSISNLSGSSARVMPALYQNRAAISLYDAQYDSDAGEQRDIPEEVIEKVITEFKLFKRHCRDFGVPESNIKVLATEATRKASNSDAFRAKIKQETSWDVTVLSKEVEGQVGAMGVASSFRDVSGLIMDLGGGSLQLTWMISNDDGEVRFGKGGSVSLPYGAAALLQRLEASKKETGAENKAGLQAEIEEKLAEAYSQVRENAVDGNTDSDTKDGIELYLSGGGFRGWGNICMDVYGSQASSSHTSNARLAVPQHPTVSSELPPTYPIPIINGFSISGTLFSDVDGIINHVDHSNGIFRVSGRRAKQAHAVAVLVAALTKALPTKIKRVHFSQGGVREGALFSTMPATIRAIPPLNAATAAYAPRDADATALLKHLTSAIPSRYSPSSSPSSQYHSGPPSLIADLLRPTVNLLYVQQPFHKEVRSAAALRSTTSGILAGFHGISHRERAALALILCARWESKLPPADEAFQTQLQAVAGVEVSWWAKYIGAVAALIGDVYPAGIVNEKRLKLKASIAAGATKSAASTTSTTTRNKKEKKKTSASAPRDTIVLRVDFPSAADGDSDLDDAATAGAYADQLKEIKKVGKKKNWISSGDSVSGKFGLKVKVRVKVYLPAHSAAATVLDERRSESDSSDDDGGGDEDADEHETEARAGAGAGAGAGDEDYEMLEV